MEEEVLNRGNPLLTVRILDDKTGLPLEDFKFLVNENNVGNPFDSDKRNWPSLRGVASHSPVIATGDSSQPVISLPPGKYVVTVRAPGFKLSGNYVTLEGDTTVIVRLQPHPLPLARVRVHVFHDNSPVNGEDDFPLEQGLPGFSIVIGDAVGEVTTDYFGNVLGTQYEKDDNGNYIFDPDGNPIPIPNTGGIILTDENGDAVIDNLAPGKYEVQAIPPDGTDWVQTTTIEGTPVIDVWIEEGNDGYLQEEGFKFPVAWVGFIKPMEFPVPAPGENTGTITTQIRTVVEAFPEPTAGPLDMGDPVDRPWVALTDIGRTDKQVFLGRGNTEGKITITNVPPGLYQMAVWDEPLDYIISFRTVQIPEPLTGNWDVNVSDDPVNYPGLIVIPRWFGWIKGRVFQDENLNGIPNVEVGTRFKDGSIQYSTVTDLNGNYGLNEIKDLGLFTVAEVGFTRLGRTSAVATPDYQGPSQGTTTVYEGDLTLAALTIASSKNRIDWGKKDYPLIGSDGQEITNGGITGIVYYATMRNELDPRFAMAEDYEPGIPNVVVNLYATIIDPETGQISRGPKINSVTTDAWEPPLGPDGLPIIEVAAPHNYITRGVFDGGYAFEPLPEGTYIVEVEVPDGYKILDESSVNTGEGDTFVPNPEIEAAIMPPPYEGDSRAAKIVYLNWGLNAAADFFLYTEVPVPGRIIGLLSDDLNIESDPSKLFYGEKRGIPNTPVGIRDFTGRLITTVHTDPNGIFEVLLPSTYTANVPFPSGLALGMYQFIGNDPGDQNSPNSNFNPDYQTIKLVFDVWPGKTTFADVAIFPITAYTSPFIQPPPCEAPSDIPQILQVNEVVFTIGQSRTLIITGNNFDTLPGQVTLNNRSVSIMSWSNTRITCIVPFSFSGGAWQLLVYRRNGAVTPVGTTLHVLGFLYRPSIVRMASGETIQSAIDRSPNRSVIVVPPGTYYESPIIYKSVKLQGYGPEVTRIDGRFYRSYQDKWLKQLVSLDYDGPADISNGQTITVVAKKGSFSRQFPSQIDGLTISDARGTWGGGIYVHAYCQYLQIGNCIIRRNGGGFGGAITIGKAYIGDNYNNNIRIHHNRILNNGGVSLAGAIGIFNGADNYEIDHNEICGNYSAEYGGGISHFGLSRFGKIHHNLVQFNASFDEGSGIFIGGEQPLPPADLSSGSGEVEIYNNHIRGNVANDDGGGIRLLQPGTFLIKIYNNMVVNNVSTDLGGGIALDDASNVVIYNNTIAKNITTATAEDSDRKPHGAGLVSEGNSAPFQASLPPGSPVFSDPVLFNNLFWDNRAHHFDLTTGKLSTDYQLLDLEVFGTNTPQKLSPNYCYLSTAYGLGSGNIIYNGSNPPNFIKEYDTKVEATTFIGQPDFKSIRIIVTPEAAGDYHLRANSPAIDSGTRTLTAKGLIWQAPDFDFDDTSRPWNRYDIGADEYRPRFLFSPFGGPLAKTQSKVSPQTEKPSEGVKNITSVNKRFGATDGLIKMPDGSEHYIFGFVDISGVPQQVIFNYRGKAQLLAPLLEAKAGQEVYLTMTNLGMPARPDLDDSHTVHWHGFPNQIPLWDGVPEASIAVPVGRDFVYYYKPLDPGTYMFHCHFEPVEHIQMGMAGPLLVRPADYDPGDPLYKTAYGRETGTEFDREYFIFLTELDAKAHYQIASVQEYDWTEYQPDYWLINGRTYPDTLDDTSGNSFPSQPYHAHIKANAGEKVLLRFVNLGYQQHAIEILGIPLQIVGQDAQRPLGLNGENLAYRNNVVYIGAGQTIDAIFTASSPGTYPLFNRNCQKNLNAGQPPGGMVSEVQVHPGTLPPQEGPGQ